MEPVIKTPGAMFQPASKPITPNPINNLTKDIVPSTPD